MTMISASTLARWADESRAREFSQIENLMELRAYITDAKAEGARVVLQMYVEAAPSFRITPRSLQNKILVLREYPDDKLRKWIADGYSFDTIDRVGKMADMGMTNGEAPADVLDRLSEQGNATGGSPSAVDVENVILEQNGIKPAEYIFNKMGYKFAVYYKLADPPKFMAELRELVRKHSR
jgi:DNA-binding transcriptional ArsR family regulator